MQPSRALRLPILLVAAALAFGASACGGDNNEIAAASCTTIQDCNENEVCIDRSGGGQPVCVEAECGCPGCAACADGFTCSGAPGVCIAAGGTGAGADAVNSSDVRATCPEIPCGDGTECVNGQCVPTDSTNLCTTCNNDAECGGAGDLCTALANGSFCTSGCTDDAGCPTGFTCYAVTNDARQCVPNSFRCEGCVVDGCPDGQVCNFGNGQCAESRSECESCNFDYECSSDGSALCYRASGNGPGVCAPACGAGDTCPANSQCSDAGGKKVCAFTASVCCYGAGCENCNCAPPTAQCKGGTCVACLGDADCPGDTGPCDAATNSCTGGSACPADRPHDNNGTCVQCLNGTHCGSGTCDTATFTCTGDACSVCSPPYPACAEIAGQTTCVQCSPQDTAYCESIGGTCDTATFTCLGGQEYVGNCSNDGCTDPNGQPINGPFSGTPLQCHSSGACIDESGFCDGVTASCPSGDCISLLGGLTGGGGLPIPIPGGGGGGGGGGLPNTGIPGFCKCDTANGGSDCAAGSTCLDMTSIPILGQAFGPLLGNEPVCFNCDSLGAGGDPISGALSLLCSLSGGGGGGFPFPFP